MRIIGPNCLGLMSPLTGLNATFAARHGARRAMSAFISQSGALCTAVLDWSFREQVGFSRVRFDRLDGRRRLGRPDRLPRQRPAHPQHSDLHGIDRRRPIVPLARPARWRCTSRSSSSSPAAPPPPRKAAASHTGSLTGSDEVLEAAFRRSGVLRVNNISDLFYMAEVLAKQPRPAGPAADDSHQRRRSGGAGDRRADHRGRRSDGAFERNHGGLEPGSSRRLEPQQPRGHPRRRGARALRQGARDRRQRPERRRHAGHPDAAGDDRPDQNGRAAESLREDRGQASARELDGRHRGRRRRRRSSTTPASRRSPIPTPPRARSTTCGATATTCGACTRRRWRPRRKRPRRTATKADEHHSDRRASPAARFSPSSNRSSCWPTYGIPTVETHIATSVEAGGRAGREDRLSRSCSSSTPRRSRTRPMSAACS